ncbi:stress-activated map kinase interacting protein 1-domain-containing protein [Dipodascopsis uninucleata]
MSLLMSKEFILYSIRRDYLDRMQDGLAERVVHIDENLYRQAYNLGESYSLTTDPVAQFGAQPYSAVLQYSPPIPSFVESDRSGNQNRHQIRSNRLSHESAKRHGHKASDATSTRHRRRKNRRSRTSPHTKFAKSETDSNVFYDSDFAESDTEVAFVLDSDETPDNDSTTPEDDDNNEEMEKNEEDNYDASTANEMDIEELQRAARKIKFSKMPAREKDLIPDVDQMLSTYIQTARGKRNGQRSKQKPDNRRNSSDTWQDIESESIGNIGLAGNTESEDGKNYLESSSFRRGGPYHNLWSTRIAMDDDSLDAEVSLHSDINNIDPNDESLLSSSYVSPPPIPLKETEITVDGRREAMPVALPHVSKLTALIRISEAKAKNPFEKYTSASGVGELKPLKLKIYRPTSETPKIPFEVVVKRSATVADTTGYALYRYWEEKRKPELDERQCDLSYWTLRIVEEDGEPDLDFPALDRTRIISAFSFDEFALVEATPSQVSENKRLLIATSS